MSNIADGAETPRVTKLGRLTILGYGSFSWGLFAADTLVNMFFLQFLLDFGKVNPTIAGFVLSAGEGSELIASFFVGLLSDKTRSPLGRRHPWILAGTFLLPLAVMLMFFVLPSDTSSAALAIYYFAFAIIYNMFFSISSIPHQAMSPDIASNYDDRLSLSTSRSIFSFVGMLGLVIWAFFVVGYIIPAIQTRLLADVPAPISPPVASTNVSTSPFVVVAPSNDTSSTSPVEILAPLFDNGAARVKQFTHQLIAAFPSGFLIIFGIFCLVTTRRFASSYNPAEESEDLDESGRVSRLSFCRILGVLLRTRSFVIVCLMYTFVGTAIAVTQSVLPLFILYTIGLPNGLQRFTEVTIAITASMIVTIVFVSRVGSRFEKRTLFNFGAVLSVLVYVGYFFVPGLDNLEPDVLRYGIYVFGIFSGIGQALAYTLPNAMMSDVTDEALLTLREKHEGMMFSLMETLQSFLQASTMWIIGLVLDQYGYTQTGATQPYEVRQIIRYMFCFVPVAAFGFVWLLSFAYPITRDRHKEILRRIRELDRKEGTSRSRSAPSSRVLASKNILTATMARPNFEDKEEENLARVTVEAAEMERAPQVQDSTDDESVNTDPEIVSDVQVDTGAVVPSVETSSSTSS